MYEFKSCWEVPTNYGMMWNGEYRLFLFRDFTLINKNEYKLIKKSVQCDIRELTYRGYELTFKRLSNRLRILWTRSPIQ